ncbi:hypothetical protein [Providencia burhodogranariea]|uniref:Uncharacterized protein n=1 Tax=Providencia burhodogranariea DSM 19968 TaxID=1141662 RepID=K8WP76_9GAMM|nr:hypothetical protein [Providencia burhodogranariea]EKT62403.1 hypothetical protein OOA_07445 [Providencia burhodogranariea DSM 19968]
MKKLTTTLTTLLMLIVIAIAALFIVFPQQWKQSVYPNISQVLPESINSLIPSWGSSNNACDSLESNLETFADYLKANQDVVSVKGMNGLDEQLSLIRSRVDQMPNQVRKLVCQQENARLEGLKSVFFLGHNNSSDQSSIFLR